MHGKIILLLLELTGVAAFAPISPTNAMVSTPRIPPPLPDKLVIGYCSWSQCDDKIISAVRNGVNVVIWFSLNLVGDGVEWRDSPTPECVADIVQRIRELDGGSKVVHLMSIGGWNSPHPDTMRSPQEVFLDLDRWNREVIARPDKGWLGFDGWDWDIEGNDDVDSKHNHFSKDCLDMMGIVAQCAKRHGYIFGMAPAESYLDPSTPLFDRSLRHDYPEWRELQPDFKYHGRNCYAFLLAKYGRTTVGTVTAEEAGAGCLEDICGSSQAPTVSTFDFVTIQLYEGYSHAEYSLNVLKADPAAYIVALVEQFQTGWSVEFGSDHELGFTTNAVTVVVPPTQLVLGLANGWAGDGKFYFLNADRLADVSARLREANLPIRGFAFWNIQDEGMASKSDPSTPVYLARVLKEIL